MSGEGVAVIRLFLADDMPAVREVMRLALEGVTSQYRVVGEAADGLSALAEIARLVPDVIILDVDMPGLGGLEVVRQLRSRGDATPVILCSSWEGRAAEQLPPGVTSCLQKPFPLEVLASAVAVAAGALVQSD